MAPKLKINNGPAQTPQDRNYDSRLELGGRGPSTNADFFLTLKLWFVEYAESIVKDGNKREFEAVPWNDPDPYNPVQVSFAAWKSAALRLAADAWDQKLWLRTPDDYAEFDCPGPGNTKFRPNLHCRLECVEAASRAQAHAEVTCVRLRALTSGGATPEFRSNSHLWDSADIESRTGQVTVAHEVGHLLGLPHVGAFSRACVEANDENAKPCYEYEGDSSNIMGKGMVVTGINAWPWMKRIAEHTGTSPEEWKPWNSRWVPRKVG